MNKKFKYTLISIAALFFFIFILWSSFVWQDSFIELDNNVIENVLKFRGEKNEAWYYVGTILTQFGFLYVMIPLFIITLIMLKGDLKSSLLAAGTGVTYCCNMAVKLIVRRERPLEALRWAHEISASYPSSHTMCSTFMYGFIAYLIYKSNLNKKLKTIIVTFCIVIIPVIGFTRVLLCVHYFSDVVGGFLFGIVTLTGGILLYEYLCEKNFNGLQSIFKRKKNS